MRVCISVFSGNWLKIDCYQFKFIYSVNETLSREDSFKKFPVQIWAGKSCKYRRILDRLQHSLNQLFCMP